MKLAETLIGFLNRVFNKDPMQFLALTLGYDGGLTWAVEDLVLTLTANGGSGHSLTIDLTQYSVSQLADYIGAQTGYSIVYVDRTSLGQLGARVLLDASGDLAVSNGGNLYGYTSILWSYMNALAVPLKAAEQQIETLPAEMSTTTADGIWLDVIGGYYGVFRLAGEGDAQYGPRIIATVIAPKGNNRAMEIALKTATGQTATVVDAPTYSAVFPVYNGTFNFDGRQHYTGTRTVRYGLFDVTIGYDLLGSFDIAGFESATRALIELFRDAGTHLRAFDLIGGTISDSWSGATEAGIPFAATFPIVEAANSPSESLGGALGLSLSDTDVPTEPGIVLLESWTTTYNGVRFFDGYILYNSGGGVSETV